MWTRTVVGLGLALILILGSGAPAGAQDEKPKANPPLSEAAIIKLAKSGLEEEVVVAVVKKRGISFKADDAARKRLKDAGVPDAILAALPGAPAAAAKPADDDKGGDDKPLATARHAKGLIVEVLEVSPDPDKPTLITIRWRYRNPTKKRIELIASSGQFATKSSPIGAFWNGVYYLEGNKEDNKSYRCSVATDNGGKRWATDTGRAAVVIKPDEQYEFWGKFRKPEPGTTKISFHVLDTPPIESIPLKKK